MKPSSLLRRYQDFVIKDGKFVGEFEKMYQECPNPWPQTVKSLNADPISRHAVTIIRKNKFKKLFSVGSGKGFHAQWLINQVPDLSVQSCEISKTAVEYSQKHFPDVKVEQRDVKDLRDFDIQFDVILFREVLWYILPYWRDTVEVLTERHKGKHIIIEISCYDTQSYGRGYFDGPEDFIKKFPFQVKEILRYHTTPLQREGFILIFGQI